MQTCLCSNAPAAAFRVESDPARGRHLVAARDLSAGELILEDYPIVVGPATRSRFDRFIQLSLQTFQQTSNYAILVPLSLINIEI